MPTVPRPSCSVFVATSLDGFIARRDGRLDWLAAASTPGEDYGYQELFDGVDTILLGRNTWEVARRFERWPYRGKRVVVLAHAPVSGSLGEEFMEGDPAEVLGRLGEEGARRVYADGGSVVSQLLAAGCVDEIVLSIVPVVLGEGIRLFQPPLPQRPLELVAARPFPSGLVQLRYRPPGAA